MTEVTIVGSGASAVHFALSVLQKGYAVTMFDVGFDKPEMANPKDTLNGLKENLADPVEYFLGKKYEALIMPDAAKEYYGIPPSKNYVFKIPDNFQERSTGFEPLFSFARGGLAEAWTGGAYAYNDEELADFPFKYRDIEPFYNEIAKRIGILGEKDDLASFHPWHENLLPPLEFDEHAALLYAGYQKKRELLHKKYSCYFGRSRLAVLSRDYAGRQACDYSGRCMWGCPSDSLYVPSLTLKTCLTFPAFTYIPNMLVTHFKYGVANRIETVVAYDLGQKQVREFPVQRLVLAAGTLGTAKIFLNSIYRQTGQTLELQGLMDNRQILIPFINLHLAGKTFKAETYQYHQLAMGIVAAEPKKFIHGQITTLKTALMHPIIESIPMDLKSSLFLGRNLHAALGVANINFYDDRRHGNYVTIAGDADPLRTMLRINYSPPVMENKNLKNLISQVKQILLKLGVIVPPGMLHVRPMGASVHYAGTIPMSTAPLPLTASANCHSHDFANLHFVDGTCFPFLPAKNLTFTLMANATRVAALEF